MNKTRSTYDKIFDLAEEFIRDEDNSLCVALTSATNIIKDTKYRCHECRLMYGLYNYMPKGQDPEVYWFPMNNEGKKIRLKILNEIRKNYNDTTYTASDNSAEVEHTI